MGAERDAFDPKAFAAELSHRPGVYRMRDADGNVIYVGKARDLKKRVTTYFSGRAKDAKTMAMVERVAGIDVTLTNTESEALLTVEWTDGMQVAWLIGLDNVVRFSPGLYGLPGTAKGEWESDSTFVVHLDEIGRINQEDIKMTFADEQITFEASGVTVVGRVHEN